MQFGVQIYVFHFFREDFLVERSNSIQTLIHDLSRYRALAFSEPVSLQNILMAFCDFHRVLEICPDV